MHIEFSSNLDEDNIPAVIEVDIDENLPIKDLFDQLHEITGVERYIEAVWFDNTEKISCNYFVKESTNDFSFKMINNIDQIIKDFPKMDKMES